MNKTLNPITEKQIAAYVAELRANIGGEMGHIEADDLLCAVLDDLGLREITDAYNNVPDKWYA